MCLRVVREDFSYFGGRVPEFTRAVKAKALCDTGAQMVLMGTWLMDRLGLRKEDLLDVKVRILAVNGENIPCCGGFPLQFLVPDEQDLSLARRHSWI